jgi:hypothetical protein
MTPQELIRRLAALSRPDRDLDDEIGKLIGYTQILKVEADSIAGKQAGMAHWKSPNGDEGRMPYFTHLIHDAHLLAQTLFPNSIGGASWDETGGAARVDGGPYVTAANPAIAICIAVLAQMEQADGDDDDSQEDMPD